jgi:CO dehydrogenase/acetyl-CoA synthase delta subunit
MFDLSSMTSATRIQRLIDEFEDAAAGWGSKYNIRHGIAAVLRHLADTDAQYGDMESWYAVPARTLEDLADALEAPTLLDRAMAGDATAAKQFLHEAGFTDKQGQWLPQYQSIPEATND